MSAKHIGIKRLYHEDRENVEEIENVGRGGYYVPYFVVNGERKWYNQICKFRLMEVKR